ncbi:amidohydrolase family protein [Bradyrhizobium sp. AUGA SZCCT0240]|uniref:amidohydrolase family protein n=1 Tax=Bradyrhizobium sp. AUGA SZCCT0240 TaxID=2807669 RepID=UPI001BA6B9F2|nr:amidohydrolase family protein [Bradyrhizobium sp. AUGA SZCCT0240]MBR1252304.1 amidohydrolase family protein [Bradyrhizobium sp. AUGA SZCCT0240]
MQKIDVHTHIVPDVLPADPRRSEAWPSVEIRSREEAAVMVRGKVFRAIDSRSWDVDRRIKDMQEDGVDVQVLSPMPELLSHWLPTDEADDLCTIVNTQIAKMISARAHRFRGIGMVPMQDPELAAKRLEEVRSLGLLGIEIGTHVNGLALGDERLHPVYAAAEALGLVVFVHPLHPTGLERIGGKREFAAISAFPLETAYATVSMIGGRILERFPKLRVLLSHGGGAAAWIFPRIDFACSAGSLLRDYLPESAARTVKRFWYDTITYDDEALGYLASRVGGDRLVVGSDYPFLIRQPRPAAFAERVLPKVDFGANTAALFSR